MTIPSSARDFLIVHCDVHIAMHVVGFMGVSVGVRERLGNSAIVRLHEALPVSIRLAVHCSQHAVVVTFARKSDPSPCDT